MPSAPTTPESPPARPRKLRPWSMAGGVLLIVAVSMIGAHCSARAHRQQIADLEAALNQAGLELIDAGRPEAALAAFDQMLTLDPGNLYALNNRSLVFLHLGRYEEARQAAEAALKVMPDCAAARLNRDNAITRRFKAPAKAVPAR